MLRSMAELHFLPHYAEVLESVMRQAEEQGVVDVECRVDLDPAVVASQVQMYAASTGRKLRCRPQRGRVEVRCGTRSRPDPPVVRGA
jgi:hypothetical protein